VHRLIPRAQSRRVKFLQILFYVCTLLSIPRAAFMKLSPFFESRSAPACTLPHCVTDFIYTYCVYIIVIICVAVPVFGSGRTVLCVDHQGAIAAAFICLWMDGPFIFLCFRLLPLAILSRNFHAAAARVNMCIW
jgi:hypothetical protein